MVHISMSSKHTRLHNTHTSDPSHVVLMGKKKTVVQKDLDFQSFKARSMITNTLFELLPYVIPYTCIIQNNVGLFFPYYVKLIHFWFTLVH